MFLAKVSKVEKFPFAIAKDRLLAKLFDFFFLSVILLALGFLIFYFDENFSLFGKWQKIRSWRYLVFGFTTYLIYYFWMLFFPFFFNWQTIGMKIFKLKFFSFKKNKKQMLKGLILHDLFIWEISINTSLILSFFLFFLSNENSEELLHGVNLVFSMQTKSNNIFFYLGLVFGVLYSSNFLLLCFIIIGIFLHNKYPTYHDNISNFYIIKLIPLGINEKDYRDKNVTNNKTSLPGVVDLKSLDEILDDNKK